MSRRASHHKIKQWPGDKRAFAKTIRDAVLRGTDPDCTTLELDPVEPEIYHVSPTDIAKKNGPWAHTETFLHRATRLHLFDLAEFLVASGADVNKRNELGRTPLHEAVLSRSWLAVAFLLQQGAEIEALTGGTNVVWYEGTQTVHGEKGLTPMHLALHNSDVDLLHLLVAQGADIHHKAHGVWSYLDLALLSEDRRALDFLVSRGMMLHKEDFGFADPKKSHTLAKQLLACTSSHRLVPPAHLWDVYREALARLHFCKWALDLENAEYPPTAEEIAMTFSDHVETLAGISRDCRDLCDDCSQLADELYFFFEDSNNRKPFEHQLKPSRLALLETADRRKPPCSLCSFLADMLDIGEAGHRSSKGRSITSEWKPNDGPIQVIVDLVDGFTPGLLSKVVRVNCGTMELAQEADRDGYSLDIFGWSGKIRTVNASVLSPSYEAYDARSGTGSDKAMATAKRWLHHCQETHTCKSFTETSAESAHRVMLIEVGPDDGPPRLVKDPGGAAYVALMHDPRDELSSHLVEGMFNFEGGMTCFPSLEFWPAGLRNAIVTTKRLGFRYLWIYQLCMVPGSANLWHERTSQLHTIYHNAALTISGFNASSISDNLTTSRQGRSPYPVPLTIWQPKSHRPAHRDGFIHTSALVQQQDTDVALFDAVLSNHAWVVQQELFSPRILHFGKGILHWECLCEYTNEALSPAHGSIRNIVDKRIALRAACRGWSTSYIKDEAKSRLSIEPWQYILEDYTQREFDAISDRLPAIWPVGRQLEGFLQDEFACGIFKGDKCLESLCWAVTAPADEEPSLPSWTWVSASGPVTFACLDKSGRNPEAVALTSVISFDGSMDPYTYAVSGSLTLCGPLLRFEDVSKDWMWEAKFLDSTRSETSPEVDDVDAYASPFDGIDMSECYVLELLGFKGRGRVKPSHQPWPAGRGAAKVSLVLKRVANESATFRRVGIAIMELARGNLNVDPFREQTIGTTIRLV